LSSPEADLPLLTDAARRAGDLIMGYFRRGPKRWDKPGEAGPVTEADLAADADLAERLRAARPDYGWLSEETPDDQSRLAHRRVFVVDPIDGTRAFIAGEEGWCVALAVVEDGAPVAAVAWFPARGERYAAARGAGATRDGARIAPSACASADGALMLTGAQQLAERHWPGGAPAVRREFRPSLVHRLCLAADGGADAALTLSDAWEWDIAAGALIAAEAGCAVTNGYGAPLRFNGPTARLPGVIAAGPALHAALMARRRGR
jgi:myo-inositol-1(or 4)-monophosphatase